MKPISADSVLKTVKEYFLMAFGMMLYSFGWIGMQKIGQGSKVVLR